MNILILLLLIITTPHNALPCRNIEHVIDYTQTDIKAYHEPCVAHSKPVELRHRIIPARITCYLETGNNMANSKYPESGWVATSDRNIPFNTEIEIDGLIYKVGDRTNKRF